MAEGQKWVNHLHLETTVLIAVAGENGRIVIQGFNIVVKIFEYNACITGVELFLGSKVLLVLF